MTTAYTAQMAQHRGRWRVYVVLLNTTDPWPTYTFPAGSSVPTVPQRARALEELGFTLPPGREWSWVESNDDPNDEASAVVLIATSTVEEVA